MKTTIDISDNLMSRCRKVVHERHVTFRSLVEDGLTRVLEERGRRQPFKLRAVKVGSGGFQPGFDEAGWDRIRDVSYEGRGS